MNLGEYVKQYRDEHNLSQRAFAELCGVSNGYISLIERDAIDKRTGKPSKPKIDSLMAIAKGMGLTLQELVDAVDVDIPVDLGPIKVKTPTLVIEDERTVEFIQLFSQLSSAEQDFFLAQIKGVLSSR